jgi:hypothetical protein
MREFNQSDVKQYKTFKREEKADKVEELKSEIKKALLEEEKERVL